MPFSTAQTVPLAYHVSPPAVSAPARRASTVLTMPRVMERSGPKASLPTPLNSSRDEANSTASFAQWSAMSLKRLALSMILSRTSPSARSATPVSVTTEPLTISSVPSGWTITATMLPLGLLTGMSTRVLPTLLGTLTDAVISPLAGCAVLISVPSARFSTVLTLPSGFVSATVVLPSSLVVVSTVVPSGFVSVLVVEPSAFVTVSVLPTAPPEAGAEISRPLSLV